ncbi:MAG: hypothetical protein ABIR54_16390 [Burkholderiaceae bacterium]
MRLRSAFTMVVSIVLLAVITVLVVSVVFMRSQTRAVDSFCAEVAAGDTSQSLGARAGAKGLFFTKWQGTDDVWILNKPLEARPFFRFACVVKFKNGAVSGKEVIDAD